MAGVAGVDRREPPDAMDLGASLRSDPSHPGLVMQATDQHRVRFADFAHGKQFAGTRGGFDFAVPDDLLAVDVVFRLQRGNQPLDRGELGGREVGGECGAGGAFGQGGAGHGEPP